MFWFQIVWPNSSILCHLTFADSINWTPSTQFCNAQNLLNIKAFYECNRKKHLTSSWICRRINTFYLVCLECTHTHGAVSHMMTQDALFNGLLFKIQWTIISWSNYNFRIYRWKSYETSSQSSLLFYFLRSGHKRRNWCCGRLTWININPVPSPLTG